MIESSEKRNRRLAFELQNSHVYEKCIKAGCFMSFNDTDQDCLNLILQ